ncbi:MAG: hypothetical protein RJA06_584, partial [Bacteroidota bacterium]
SLRGFECGTAEVGREFRALNDRSLKVVRDGEGEGTSVHVRAKVA